MNRSSIITSLSELYPRANKKEIDFLVRKMLGLITNSIALGHRVEIRGFGCFSLKERSGKIRNPRKGLSFEVDSRVVVYFRAGKELKERVRCAA